MIINGVNVQKIISVKSIILFLLTDCKRLTVFSLVPFRLRSLTMQVLQVLGLLVALGLSAAKLSETVDYSG